MNLIYQEEEKPKFGAKLRGQNETNTTTDSRDISTKVGSESVNTSMCGDSNVGKLLNQSMSSTVQLSGQKQAIGVSKSETQVAKNNQNRISIEEENENAGSSETDSPGQKQDSNDVDPALEKALEENQVIALQRALREVLEQNESLHSRVAELEQKLDTVTAESNSKDTAILELASALENQHGVPITDAINQLNEDNEDEEDS